MNTAKGTFDVKLQPPPRGEGAGRLAVGRMLIDKQFSGDFTGVGQGEMLSAGNPAAGSAAYVAIDHITGTIGARHGSFALQHVGVLDQGDSSLTIIIVPGSGTGDFKGIKGELKLDIVNGAHHYTLEYTLPE